MTKRDPKKLLEQSLKDAKIKDKFVDFDSINLIPLRKIIDARLYDPAIDWSFFWNIYLVKTLSAADYNSSGENRDLTEEEKAKIISSVHDLASGVPYDYSFYYLIPDNYPGKLGKFGDLELIQIDKNILSKLEADKPVEGKSKLSEALARLSYEDNIPKLGEKYILIKDSGLVRTGIHAFLESSYSPDRLVGLFYSLHAVYGTLNTNKYVNHVYTPRVFDSSNKYVSNFKNPNKSHRAATIAFEGDAETTDYVTSVLESLVTVQNIKNLEAARIQICNALHWYLEYLKNEDWALQLVFLVSVIDSLFPTRKNIAPTVNEKAPVIAATLSSNESEKDINIETIEKLFTARNEVIHGKIEIHGYSKASLQEKNQYLELISLSEEVIQNYLLSRIKRYLS